MEDDIPGGIPAGSRGLGHAFAFLKEDRLPLLSRQPPRTAAVLRLAGGRSPLLELTLLKSDLLPRLWLPPAEVCQIP